MTPLMQHQGAADDDLALSAPTSQAVDSSPAGGGPAQDEMQPPPPGHIPAGEDRADIIRFPQSSRSRDAENVPLPPDRSEPEEEPVPAVVPSPTPIGRRSSGKMAAAGVGAGAGAVGGNVTPGECQRKLFPPGNWQPRHALEPVAKMGTGASKLGVNPHFCEALACTIVTRRASESPCWRVGLQCCRSALDCPP